MFYEEIFQRLGKDGIQYAVAGGVALVLHGVVRFTADLDLIVELGEENLRRFLAAMDDLGFRPRLPVPPHAIIDPENRKRWREERNMRVFAFHHPSRPMRQIDVFVEEFIPFRDLDRELVRMTAGGISIPVVSKTHLKMLKRIANRPQDIADIEALESLDLVDDAHE